MSIADLTQEGRTFLRQLQWRASCLRRRVASLGRLPLDANFVVVSVESELSDTQVYPFHLYADRIRARFGAEFYEVREAALLGAPENARCPRVKWVAFQTWFDLTAEEMTQRANRIQTVFPNARLIYLDFFAPLDLRYAEVLAPHITHYVKKQVFADFKSYGTETVGHTNLTDYYGRRFGIPLQKVRWNLPPEFLPKLVIGSNFCVSPHMIDRFSVPLLHGARPIDVHARIATGGEEWYRAMRSEALNAALTVKGLRTVSDGRVSRARFFEELRQSKICFSPFGYGEVCWRDYEAIFSGALLVKPDMGHVRLSPAIFVPNETYVPIAWDCSDYDEKVRLHVAQARRRREICSNAFDMLREYVRSDEVVTTLAPLFAQDDRGIA